MNRKLTGIGKLTAFEPHPSPSEKTEKRLFLSKRAYSASPYCKGKYSQIFLGKSVPAF
ncbi:hypothetical protein HNQ44_001484 [Planomicrobium koreense]|uniref:Uncharacterized protein n=1 Tax=Planococcus koreensis TaxID=112331 RepID=A0A7W8CR11_9BACL|nr:hypothetical protein [Planococcus koreensis]MBB5180060.1 hypothetical protein [Planococcus koreensis]